MSYRNPQIIVDRSAEIYAKLANVGTDFFNSYMKASNNIKQANAKRNAGMLKAINKSTEKYDIRLEKGLDANKIDDASLIEQVQAIADKKLNGADGQMGIIKKDAMLNMGLVDDPALRRQYREDIRKYKAWEARALQNTGGYEAQIEDYEDQVDASTLGSTKQIAGQGTERFINLTALETLRRREIEGVDVTRNITDDGDIIISGKIDTSSDAYKEYVNDGLIDPEDLKIQNGIASFEWRSNSKNPVKDLLINLIPDFDQLQASQTSGLQGKDGKVTEALYTGKRDTETIDAGEGRVYDETKIYINPEVIRTNRVFRDEAQAFAKGVRVSSRDQQIDVLEKLGVPKENMEEYLKNPSAQTTIIEDALIQQNIERLTGSADVKQDADGSFYITEYSKDRAKPKPEVGEEFEEKTGKEQINIQVIDELKIPTISDPIRDRFAIAGVKPKIDLKATNELLRQKGFETNMAVTDDEGKITVIKVESGLSGKNRIVQITQDTDANTVKDLLKQVVTGKAQLPVKK